MYIANPIYDVVLTYLMEDNKVAKQFISAIIGEQIEELEFAPPTPTADALIDLRQKAKSLRNCA